MSAEPGCSLEDKVVVEGDAAGQMGTPVGYFVPVGKNFVARDAAGRGVPAEGAAVEKNVPVEDYAVENAAAEKRAPVEAATAAGKDTQTEIPPVEGAVLVEQDVLVADVAAEKGIFVEDSAAEDIAAENIAAVEKKGAGIEDIAVAGHAVQDFQQAAEQFVEKAVSKVSD